MNQSSVILHSIQEVPLLYKRLFGKELDFYDMLEMCPLVLRKTGSIAIKAYLFKGTVENYKLELPCNVYGIKHVCDSKPTSWYSRYSPVADPSVLFNYRVDQSGNLGIYNENASNADNLGDESSNGVYEINKNVFTAPLGGMIDFNNDDNKCLHFNFKDREVDVLYVGTVTDADGFPKLPEKTLEAIAYFMNHVDVRMKYNMRQADGNMEALARQDSIRAIAQARVPSFVSQNELDDLLNVFTSSNKKRHNFQHRK